MEDRPLLADYQVNRADWPIPSDHKPELHLSRRCTQLPNARTSRRMGSLDSRTREYHIQPLNGYARWRGRPNQG